MSDLKNRSVKRPTTITTEEFDRKVEANEDIDDHLDWSKAVMLEPGEMSSGQKLSMVGAMLDELLATKSVLASILTEQESLSISVSLEVHQKISSEAARLGVGCEELVESWIEERAGEQKAIQ